MNDIVFETHRKRLHALAYRMLGSHADAEDAVQDVWLRWRGMDHGAIIDATGWLMRVCSNICLDVLKSARRRREHYVGQWLPEPWTPVIEAEAETGLLARAGLAQAYMLMLERLGPVERVAFVLHDVCDWSHDDIAPVIERTANNTRQILHRARRKLHRDHDRDATAKTGALMADQGRIRAFVTALIGGDVQTMLGQLAPDVILHSDSGGKASAAVNPVFGPSNVARFFAGIWRKRKPGVTVSLASDGVQHWVLLRENARVVTAICLAGTQAAAADPADGAGGAGGAGGFVDIFLHRNPDKLSLLETLPFIAIPLLPDEARDIGDAGIGTQGA